MLLSLNFNPFNFLNNKEYQALFCYFYRDHQPFYLMKPVFFIFAALLVSGCAKKYENKEVYDIPVGGSCEIYFSTNSCCLYCVEKEQMLRHVERSKILVVDPGPEDCSGCQAHYAFVFKGIRPGADTIRLKEITASGDCETSGVLISEQYVIRVREK